MLTKRKMIFKFSGLGMKNNRPRKQQARSINNFSAQTLCEEQMCEVIWIVIFSPHLTYGTAELTQQSSAFSEVCIQIWKLCRQPCPTNLWCKTVHPGAAVGKPHKSICSFKLFAMQGKEGKVQRLSSMCSMPAKLLGKVHQRAALFYQGNARQWEAAGKVGVGRTLFVCIIFRTDLEVSHRWNWTQARLTSFAIRARAGTLMFAWRRTRGLQQPSVSVFSELVELRMIHHNST